MSNVFAPERLREIRSLDDVLELLADELDWPVVADDLEEATFEYTPEELGVPADRVPRLRSINQLRPLTTHQPWGVFFLEFQGPRLPLTPLRRLLQSLVTKKRATANGQHRTWTLDSLLFVVLTDSGDAVELHFLTFVDAADRATEIRSLPWRPDHSPQQHLDRLAHELLPRLTWPDDEDNEEAWRAEWQQAFKLRHGEAIANAQRLAERMADVASVLRTRIADALDAERGRDRPFHELLGEVRQQLVADVSESAFADMCAQTLVYGTLTSRITDPDSFGASPTLSVVPLANPFLGAFFEQVHDQVAAIDLDATGLEQFVADLRETNVEAVLDQFGSTAKGGDPVVHFYEEFLTRYDRKMRADAGAFYTPRQMVRFMVRAVDDILRGTFGLPDGVADDSTWTDVASHIGIELPSQVAADERFVSMIDPATGTGTFLVEWISQAVDSYGASHHAGDGAQYLTDQVIPSMHAFELMLAPYAIAHLKVALEVKNHGGDASAVNIHLTDSLEHPAIQGQFEEMSDPVALEGQRAAELKESSHFTVCIGNPPYDREQGTNRSSTGKRKGGVVRYGVSGMAPLLDDVLRPLSEAGLGKHAKNVYNDYVYFWRWATWQATQRGNGPGIVAFITASSYLDGVSMGGLRHHLRNVFDEIWIVDLGGEGRGARPEENVFDIRTPVAIAFGVRTTGNPDECRVRYTRISGTRVEKLGWLESQALSGASWTEVGGKDLAPFVPASSSEYTRWPELTDLLPWIHSGSQYKRTWPLAPSKRVLQRRWESLLEAHGRDRSVAFKETRDRTLTRDPAPLLKPGPRLEPIGALDDGASFEALERYGYRSFDRQWAIADNRLADFPRPDLWATRGDSQVFLTTLTSTKLGRGPAATVSPYVPDLHHFRGSYGAKDVIPLWRDRQARVPNITTGLLDTLADALDSAVAPEDLFAYIYGLSGTTAFTARFEDEVGEAAGPFRVPITADAKLFAGVASLGRDLLWWHTWGERFGEGESELPAPEVGELEPMRGYPNAFSYDPASSVLTVGNARFGPVSPDVWEFEVSGLKVLRSWLGYRMADRKGKKSSPLDDIRPDRWTFTPELLQLVGVLQRTIDLTPRAVELLDAVIAGPLVDPAKLPTPTDAERKPPKA